jgi:hypothetical protein
MYVSNMCVYATYASKLHSQHDPLSQAIKDLAAAHGVEAAAPASCSSAGWKGVGGAARSVVDMSSEAAKLAAAEVAAMQVRTIPNPRP